MGGNQGASEGVAARRKSGLLTLDKRYHHLLQLEFAVGWMGTISS